MKTIFIVDDNETNLMTAKQALGNKYKSYALPSASRMLKLAEKIMPDLILLDVDMPEMDGFMALKALRDDAHLKSIPVVFLTARLDEEAEIKGFEMGALDFINKPFSTPVLLKRIETHIETDRLIKESLKSVNEIHHATIRAIADLVESRDKVTGKHIMRTQKYLEIIVNHLFKAGEYEEMASWDMSVVIPSAQLHDMGKITVSDSILNKTEKLTSEEFESIKGHCAEGEKLIDSIVTSTREDGFLAHAKKFAGSHHEKWNGSGYPKGLAGADIPLEGRIMAIADVYDALVSERPYKKPFTHEAAVEIIKKDSGTHFDPKLVEAFLNIAEDFWVEMVSAES